MRQYTLPADNMLCRLTSQVLIRYLREQSVKIHYLIKPAALSLVLFLAVSFGHPFYQSVTDLKYNAKEKAIQGSVKLFVNDIEGALKKIQGRTVDLIHPKDTVQTRHVLENYLQKHLVFTVNGKQLAYRVIGFEREEEAIWIYMELTNCPLPKKVMIENTLLYDLLSEQSNIVHMDVNGEKKSAKVDKPEKMIVLNF